MGPFTFEKLKEKKKDNKWSIEKAFCPKEIAVSSKRESETW